MRFVIALLLVVACAPAFGDTATGKKHFERARAFVRLGDHESAIREFELAYQADPRPNILYNIAQQHRILAQTGSLAELRASVAFFERYLKEKPGADDRAQVESYLLDLRSRIASAEAAAVDTSARTAADPTGVKVPTTDSPRSELPATATDTASTHAEGRRVPTWGWVLIGAGALVVVGGAVGLGLWLSAPPELPATTLGGFEAR